MATRTRQNKTSNGKNNNSAGAFYNSEHFLAVIAKQRRESPKFAWSEKRNSAGKLFNFVFGTHHCLHTFVCRRRGVVPLETVNTSSHSRNSNTKIDLFHRVFVPTG